MSLFISPTGVKRIVSRDLLKTFDFCKRVWIANNARDMVNLKISYIFHMVPTKVQEL